MADLVLREQESLRELSDEELDAVAGGQTANNFFGNQTGNVVAVQAAVNVGNINILSGGTVT